jgi:hypothetical protein
VASRDHGDPGDAPSVPPPLTAIANAVRSSAAEEARTIAASTNTGTLATLTVDGDPWASFVTYGLLGGAPVRMKDLIAALGGRCHHRLEGIGYAMKRAEPLCRSM